MKNNKLSAKTIASLIRTTLFFFVTVTLIVLSTLTKYSWEVTGHQLDDSRREPQGPSFESASQNQSSTRGSDRTVL